MTDIKRKYKVLLPIGGETGRLEVDDTVRLTAGEAENIGSDYVVRIGKKVKKGKAGNVKDDVNQDDVDDAEKNEGEDNYDSLSEKELKVIAEERGVEVPRRGKKKIIAALREA